MGPWDRDTINSYNQTRDPCLNSKKFWVNGEEESRILYWSGKVKGDSWGRNHFPKEVHHTSWVPLWCEVNWFRKSYPVEGKWEENGCYRSDYDLWKS